MTHDEEEAKAIAADVRKYGKAHPGGAFVFNLNWTQASERISTALTDSFERGRRQGREEGVVAAKSQYRNAPMNEEDEEFNLGIFQAIEAIRALTKEGK